MTSLVAYGAYVPYFRLRRSAIATVLGGRAAGGTRAVASYDEDSTTLGVEAARAALAAVPEARGSVRNLLFATATPPYLDKTNAAAIHAALGLAPEAMAVDMAGAVRSGAGALHLASGSAEDTLVVLADVRTGLPGSADERDGGDAGAAFLFSGRPELPPLAEVLAHASVTAEILDRRRTPDTTVSTTSEERFTEQVYTRLADAAFDDALERAELRAEQLDHLAVAGLHQRALRSVTGRLSARTGKAADGNADGLAKSVGNPGTAQPGLLLADALDRAEPGQTIALVVIGDGVSVLVLRACAALTGRRAAVPAAAPAAAGSDRLSYGDYLTWRGFLDRQPAARPKPQPPAAAPSLRRAGWKYGFVASRCTDCGTRQLPPARVCTSCRTIDKMTEERLDGTPATVVTYTVDHLGFTPHPPLILAVIEFDGGGRFRCELTDAAEEEVHAGMRVTMSFRRLLTADGVHNYFWKARPVR
ncbi:OB-fold domain-containing protein [Streptomyces decoyicus]|uniref:OB-fold domain-containing protein n=1 Tax=Streptomyces decoyicus TaxID=249567 RepID=UPI0036619AD4